MLLIKNKKPLPPQTQTILSFLRKTTSKLNISPVSSVTRIIRFYLFFGIYIRVADGVETSLNREYKIGNDILAKSVKCTTKHFENSFRKKREKKLIEILLVFSLQI